MLPHAVLNGEKITVQQAPNLLSYDPSSVIPTEVEGSSFIQDQLKRRSSPHRRHKVQKIEVSWGGGSHSVLFDLRTGEFHPYSDYETAAKVHEAFGGKNYYSSRSGMSGAGWIKGRMSLVTVGTYRVDCHNIEVSRASAPAIGDWTITVPVVKGSADWPNTGNWYDRYPVVLQHNEFGTFLVPNDLVRPIMTGEKVTLETRQMRVNFWRSPEEYVEATWEYQTPVRVKFPDINRIFEAFSGLETKFQWPERPAEERWSTPLNFWSRLGLHPVGDDYYKIVRGVARARYSAAELADPVRLQSAAPANVEVLTENLYIQHGDNYVAAGLFRFEREGQIFEEDFEVYLESSEAVSLLARDGETYLEVFETLQEGAHQKVEETIQRLISEEERAEAARLRQEWLADAIVRHKDEIVTADDSVNSGNCLPGTEAWALEHFRSKNPEGITLGQLAKFMADWNVSRVVEYKLRQLGEVIPSDVLSEEIFEDIAAEPSEE